MQIKFNKYNLCVYAISGGSNEPIKGFTYKSGNHDGEEKYQLINGVATPITRATHKRLSILNEEKERKTRQISKLAKDMLEGEIKIYANNIPLEAFMISELIAILSHKQEVSTPISIRSKNTNVIIKNIKKTLINTAKHDLSNIKEDIYAKEGLWKAKISQCENIDILSTLDIDSLSFDVDDTKDGLITISFLDEDLQFVNTATDEVIDIATKAGLVELQRLISIPIYS